MYSVLNEQDAQDSACQVSMSGAAPKSQPGASKLNRRLGCARHMFQAVNVVMRTKGTADSKRQPAAYVSRQDLKGAWRRLGGLGHGGWGEYPVMVQVLPPTGVQVCSQCISSA